MESFFVYRFGGLECVGHFFANVAHFCIFETAAVVASRRTTNLSTHLPLLAHLPNLATQPSPILLRDFLKITFISAGLPRPAGPARSGRLPRRSRREGHQRRDGVRPAGRAWPKRRTGRGRLKGRPRRVWRDRAEGLPGRVHRGPAADWAAG